MSLTSEYVLDLVHTDLRGTMRTKSVSRDKYIMLFIDDFYRVMWTIYLKQKSKAFHMFEVYKEKLERETSRALKHLRLDQGGKFTS